MTRTVRLTFGERLGVARTRARMQAVVLAREVGVSHATIARWEADRGGPKPDQLDVLARALGVRREWLLDGDGPVEETPDPDLPTSREDEPLPRVA